MQAKQFDIKEEIPAGLYNGNDCGAMRKKQNHFRNSCNLQLISGLRGGVSINLKWELQGPTRSQRKRLEPFRVRRASHTAFRITTAGMNGAHLYSTKITDTCMWELQWMPHAAGYCLEKNREVYYLEVIVHFLAHSSEMQIAALKNEHLAEIKNEASASSSCYFF